MALSYLEKVLRHAEKKLLAETEGKKKPTDRLDLYRRFLKLEEHRLKLAHASGESGREISRRRAQLITILLREVWQRAVQHVSDAAQFGEGAKNPEMLLSAVGGFGRGELNPGSDVDILFLYTKGRKTEYKVVEAMVEQVLYMLWDVGFKVGHAVRTLDELVEEANANLETKTSLLECRFLCGDEKLWRNFEKVLVKECIKGHQEQYLTWRVHEQNSRHEKFGGTVFVQEPNVKNGCGGLRDFQNLLWVANVSRGIRTMAGLQEAKLLYPSERKQIESAYDFIHRIRTEMHYLQKRAGDQLTLELQGRVANSLRYPQANILLRTEALMKEYYRHSHNIYLICNSLARRISGVDAEAVPKKSKWSFLRRDGRTQKIDVFTLKNGELEIADPEELSADPLLLVRVFLIAQQHDAEIGPRLALRIRRRLRHIDRIFRYRKEVREILLAIFRSKGKVGRIVRRMHELGVLGRLFPEFAPLTCLVQHEFFHRYTADEHTLVCLEMLDRILDAKEAPFNRYTALLQKIDKPHVLYLAMLLHDTGKSANSRHHSDESAVNAVKVARRFKFSPQDLATLVFLVDHHLTMAETARKKNPDDEETIIYFARIVESQERLDLLMLLTFADSEGTGSSKQWSDWKELLLWQMYRKTTSVLAGEGEFQAAARKTLDELKGKVLALVGKDIDPGEVDAHFSKLPPRYFRSIPDEIIADHIGYIHEFLCRQIFGGESGLAPFIEWRDFPQEGYSEVVFISWDRERIFSKITGAVAAIGCSILSADIYTRDDNIVIDTFRFCTPRYEAVTDERDKKKFSEILERALGEDDFDCEKFFDRKARRSFQGLDAESFPHRLAFNLKEHPEYTVLDLQTPDRPGLLYDVSECLNDFGVDIAYARITTEGGAALDTFYLTDGVGKKLEDSSILEGIAACIRKKIA
ncbi:UTP--GlnB (protein PII) uridylyltransferase, GlnD [Verrucomicrobium sp. GAS474]|uniref:[protein-PII] uridylyltransferase n=1 Tax=Verrucomicrobium sp. GAS474 TaxID=1882831 RepID=UPI00087C4E65|nr:[protein-PII] uridylyltransferase [Verrucomicrobium sp. GAS474]SDU21197.1 UTP--GlnB (protein PII) uridylyltransferase, GlnD [Verrucomicrobium sp. GAS474]